MRSRRLRRRSGLALTSLLLFQGIAMPLGVCAQGHAEHDGMKHPDHSMSTVVTDAAVGSMEHAHHGMTSVAPSSAEPSTDAAVPGVADQGAGDHGRVPVDCAAMSGCGAPALSVGTAAELHAGELRTRRSARLSFGRPLAVDLGITTPPPRI